MRLSTILLSLPPFLSVAGVPPLLHAQPPTAAATSSSVPAPEAAAEPAYYIQEYRVQGSRTIPPLAVEEAVYPYLGRGRTADDVEKARAALELAYHKAGYQAVSVEVPQQDVAEGVVFLRVSENPVGRLRVRGTRYFSPSSIKALAPELAEGRPLNFDDVNKAVMRLNRQRDLRVTPDLKPGTEPGTIDVDLKAQDNLPLHGSIELNNRYSANTAHLRLNGAISYENLWQAGHSAGFNFQVAPEKPSDATVFSAYYLARFREIDWLTLLVQGTRQNSDVSTLGGTAVAGRGSVLGFRLLADLPGSEKLFHSLSAGVDWKNFKEDVLIGGERSATPVEYFPLTVNYAATWTGKGRSTELNAGLNFGIRGPGSDRAEFDAKRYNATGGYIYFRGDLAHTQELPGGFQLYAKLQGQASPDNLINSEQFSGGGIGTVRGYLESAALGDNAALGTIELRSPSLLPHRAGKSGDSGQIDKAVNEWRLLAFVDGGRLTLNDALPEQQDTFDLFSVGIGTRVKAFNHYNGSLDLGFPLRGLNETRRGDWQLSFRVWGEF